MTRSDRFKPGDLAWISKRAGRWYLTARQQVDKGYPPSIRLEVGKPCTIIRRAFAKDYGVYKRSTLNGESVAARWARASWLVLYEGVPAMIEDEWLNKRCYRPRKPKE